MAKKKNALFAITVFIGIVGLCSSIAGSILFYFLKVSNLSVQLHLWIGLSLFFISIAFNLRYITKYIKSSKGLTMLSSLILFGLSIYIVVCINYIGYRHRIRYDFTQTKRYTLSEKTLKVLSTVQTPLQFIVNENIPENSLRDINELLNQFQYHNSKIVIRRYNPLKNPDTALNIQRDFELKPSHLLIVANQTKATTIDKAPLIDSETEKIQWFKGEQAILNALLTTTSNKVTKIYFVQGHGEVSFTETDAQKPNLLQLKNWLMTENFSLQSINLASATEGVPDDCDALVILNPIQPYTADEINKVDDFLSKPNSRGNQGHLFFAISANFSQINADHYQWIDTGIENLLLKYGVLIENKILIEPELTIKNMGFFSLLIPPNHMAPHSITEPFVINNLSFTMGDRTRAISPNAVKDKKMFFNPLLITSEKSKGIADLSALFAAYKNKRLVEFLNERESKSLCIAACTGELQTKENKENYTEDDILKTGAKVVVVGNGAFLNSPIKAVDRDLFMNSIRWLTSEKELIGSGANITQKVSWQIAPDKEWLYREIIFYIMPLFWVLIGCFVWWIRKN